MTAVEAENASEAIARGLELIRRGLGAFRELRYRGLFVDGIYLWNLVEKGIVQPVGGRPGITWTGGTLEIP